MMRSIREWVPAPGRLTAPMRSKAARYPRVGARSRLLAEAVDKGQAEGQIATRQTARAAGSNSPTEVDPPKPIADILDRDRGTAQRIVSEARKIRDAFTDDDIDTAAADWPCGRLPALWVTYGPGVPAHGAGVLRVRRDGDAAAVRHAR